MSPQFTGQKQILQEEIDQDQEDEAGQGTEDKVRREGGQEVAEGREETGEQEAEAEEDFIHQGVDLNQ